VKHCLEIVRWAFWSPESRQPAEWQQHWSAPGARSKQNEIPDDAIPTAHRRRMSALSKLAVQIALETAGNLAPDYLVFCSQHGDLTRLREMLSSIATGVELSPTAFSQSVHNASGGLYTIIAKSRAPVSSLASGASTFACAWIEAEGLLRQNPGHQVLLVCYDEPLPDEYLPYSTQRQCRYALGLLLRESNSRGFSLQTTRGERDEALPMAPLFIAWALTSDPALHISAEGQGWLWKRE
jgi:hypothetical protein